jgi:periplasmic divalent cation tolerance protein
MGEDAPVVVLVTFANMEEARAFSKAAVSERLASCVQLHPRVESTYRWNGAVGQSEEVAGVVKTTSSALGGLEERYRSMHSYEVPEFLVLPVEGGSSDYLKWLRESVATGNPAEP